MAIGTYDELIKVIVDYSLREDLGTRIDNFILLAETEMLSNPDESLKMNLGEIVSFASMSITSRSLSLPNGFQSSRKFSITIDDHVLDIEYRTPDQMKIREGSGIPHFFTIRANQIEFDILPDIAYIITVTYFSEITPLTKANQTNIVLSKYPNIYLFGCLRQVFLYTQNNESEASATNNFISAIYSANLNERSLRYGPQPQQTVSWAP